MAGCLRWPNGGGLLIRQPTGNDFVDAKGLAHGLGGALGIASEQTLRKPSSRSSRMTWAAFAPTSIDYADQAREPAVGRVGDDGRCQWVFAALIQARGHQCKDSNDHDGRDEKPGRAVFGAR